MTMQRWLTGQQLTTKSYPSWAQTIQSKNNALFMELGLPHPKMEDWRFTKLPHTYDEYALWLNQKQNESVNEKVVLEKLKTLNLQQFEQKLIFVNGLLQVNLSNWDSSLIHIEFITDMLKKNDQHKELTNYLEIFEDHVDAFESFNHASLEYGFFLSVKKQVEAPLLIFNLQTLNKSVAQPLMILEAQAQSSLNVLEASCGLDDSHTEYFSNQSLIFDCHKDSKVEHVKVQHDSERSLNLAYTHALVKENAEFKTFTLTLGGALTRNTHRIHLQDPNAKVDVNGLFAAKGKQQSNHYGKIFHHAPQTYSNQFYKGICDGESRGIFKGEIQVKKDAQKVEALQLNKNLLLSKKANVLSLPTLLVDADDVKCAHGSTTGQIAEEQVFYLTTRGIPRAKAYEMLALAFGYEALGKIDNQMFKDILYETLQSSFEQFNFQSVSKN